jgi:hypothetical protein
MMTPELLGQWMSIDDEVRNEILICIQKGCKDSYMSDNQHLLNAEFVIGVDIALQVLAE